MLYIVLFSVWQRQQFSLTVRRQWVALYAAIYASETNACFGNMSVVLASYSSICIGARSLWCAWSARGKDQRTQILWLKQLQFIHMRFFFFFRFFVCFIYSFLNKFQLSCWLVFHIKWMKNSNPRWNIDMNNNHNYIIKLIHWMAINCMWKRVFVECVMSCWKMDSLVIQKWIWVIIN